MKILLFGGTFDPPHKGHMNNLRAALELVRPDRAIVMPAGTPPHKQASGTAAGVRLKMCGCFTALSPVVEVSDWEIKNPDPDGRNYTFRTLEMLAQENPGAELYLSVGTDMLTSFTDWRRWQDILKMATLVVQRRTDDDEALLRKCVTALEYCHGRVLVCDAPAVPVSSTEIRSGRLTPVELAELLPEPVLATIRENKLYDIR